MCGLAERTMVSVCAVFPRSSLYLLVSGEGIADGGVCVVGLTSSVHGTGRVHDGVGK